MADIFQAVFLFIWSIVDNFIKPIPGCQEKIINTERKRFLSLPQIHGFPGSRFLFVCQRA